MEFRSDNCILALSPMDDVTDYPFRALCKEFGADLLYTEFISAEGINHDAFKGKRKMMFSDEMRPIGVQIFGADEEELLKCLAAIESADPDFVDLNWGCPVRKVVAKGAGSAMLKDQDKLLHITESVVRHSHIPVTVKTRIGYDFDDICLPGLARRLQDTGISMLAIHGRTRSQMYSGSADWSIIGAVKNDPAIRIPIYGNGDIDTPSRVLEASGSYGVDGILIGRGSIGNPWIFEQAKRLRAGLPEREVTVGERIEVCERHLHKSAEFYGERTSLTVMKRHYASYFKGLHDFKRFRMQLYSQTTVAGIESLFREIRGYYG